MDLMDEGVETIFNLLELDFSKVWDKVKLGICGEVMEKLEMFYYFIHMVRTTLKDVEAFLNKNDLMIEPFE